MIRRPAPGGSGGGVAFSDASDGDLRNDRARRADVAQRLDISARWATVAQVHGSGVVEVDGPGDQGEADAMFTSRAGLPLAIFTADCAGVALLARGAVGVAHAGWRGLANGVVEALALRMRASGNEPVSAAIGPSIGPCCLEVGPEVAAQFEGFTSSTSSGSPSIDLLRAIEDQLGGLETWSAGSCTRHSPGWFSHRRDRTPDRMATIAWI